MLYMLSQFGTDITQLLIFYAVIIGMNIVFQFLGPRVLLAQSLSRLEQSSNMLEGLTKKSKEIVIKKASKKPDKKVRDAINNFMDFFVIEPVNLDPAGVIKKLEHLTNLEEKRFQYFVKSIAPHLDKESQWNVIMGLSGAVTLNQVTKIIRHITEIVRKTKSYQLGMMYTMQLPLVESLAKSFLKGTEAFANGWTIGDGAGSLVGANLIGNSRVQEWDEETLMARRRIKGKEVIIIKSKGPGGRLGKLGKIVESLVKREKIAKIITVDAAAKMEGERTGSIAEGIGVAIGGIGVDRSYIENIAVEKDIPLDTIVIKMSQEEAMEPMKLEILSNIPEVLRRIEDEIVKTREKGKIIVVGVGNSNGVGNNAKEAEKSEKNIKEVMNSLKRKKEEEKESSWKFWN